MRAFIRGFHDAGPPPEITAKCLASDSLRGDGAASLWHMASVGASPRALNRRC